MKVGVSSFNKCPVKERGPQRGNALKWPPLPCELRTDCWTKKPFSSFYYRLSVNSTARYHTVKAQFSPSTNSLSNLKWPRSVRAPHTQRPSGHRQSPPRRKGRQCGLSSGPVINVTWAILNAYERHKDTLRAQHPAPPRAEKAAVTGRVQGNWASFD